MPRPLDPWLATAQRLPVPDTGLSERLWDKYRIEIPVSRDGTLLRISIAPYNDRGDVDRLLAALARELHA